MCVLKEDNRFYLTALNLADLQMFLCLEHSLMFTKVTTSNISPLPALYLISQKSYMEGDEKLRVGWPQEARDV